MRIALLLPTVVLPLFCFLLAFPLQPEWQSGSPDAFAALLLSHAGNSPFYPFLAYSMTSAVLLLVWPGWATQRVLVRFGIYTGVALAVHHWVVFMIATGADGTSSPFRLTLRILVDVLLSVVAVLVLWGLLAAAAFVPWMFKEGAPLGIVIVVAITVLIVVPDALALAAVICLFCSTPWALGSYGAMAFHVARRAPGARFQFTLAQLLGMAAWLAAYAGAWRIAWTTMLQQYAALPKSPPSCYIATAAARGHPWLVRAEQRFGPDGRAYRVNDQMRYLKAGELLLAVTCPSLHRLCRTIYDRLGPRLAACLVHPLLADAAYMALKPAEWLCRLLIAMLLPGWADLVRRMYGSGQTPTGAPNLGAPNSPLLRAGRGMTSGSPHWLESRL